MYAMVLFYNLLNKSVVFTFIYIKPKEIVDTNQEHTENCFYLLTVNIV